MKFTRLRLVGFKSFVESADFVIEPGLTAVVGPNGCGKSNLVEALRWVMGESSYRSMRASGMDDVIFSGSATRPARNQAEVTLFLDNSDRTAPASFNDVDELQVSRRIGRGEGSIYRINGREARARDVQLLFADQSTGARSPSMVGQGRVAELIQAKPQARRALLEEAAGISGLHSRRHEAELRLRAAEANLERLDNVVGGLETQVEALRRQVRAATRFKSLSAEMRQAEAALLHLRWRGAVEAENTVRSELNAATLAVAERANMQMEATKAQAVNLHGIPALRAAEAAAAENLVRLQAAKAQLEAEAARVAARSNEVARLLRQLDGDATREGRIAGDSRAVLDRLDDEETALRDAMQDEAVGLAQASAAMAGADAALALAEGALSLLTSENAEAVAAREAAQRDASAASERLRRERTAIADVEREQAQLALKEKALSGLDDRRIALSQADAAAAACERAAMEAERLLAAARAAHSAAQDPLNEARTALARGEGEARALAKIVEGASTGRRFLPASEQVSVQRGYEKALAAALGTDLDAPLDPAALIHWADGGEGAADQGLPRGVQSLADFVQAPPQLTRRLRQTGIVTDEDGDRLRAALLAGQNLVSRSGASWRWDGLTASARAPTAGSERMEQRNRFVVVREEVEAARQRLSAAAEGASAAEDALQQRTEAEKRCLAAWRDGQRAVAGARDALKQAEEAAGALGLRRAALDEAGRRVSGMLAQAEAQAQAAAGRLAALPDLAPMKRQLEEAAVRVAAGRRVQLDARSARDRLVREAEARKARLAAIAQDRQAWACRVADAARQMAELEARRALLRQEADQLAERPDEIERARRGQLGELASAEKARREAADRLVEAENRQLRLDEAANRAVATLSQAREGRARSEERLNGAEGARGAIEARIREALGVAAHLAAAQAGLDPAKALPDMADVERRLERLRSERDRLGAVNLRAEEEARELDARLATIATERGDVIEAVKALRGAIQSLNREGRERLLAAFGAVDGHFRSLFTHLFGGGTAELQLVESDDPLEAGLEIVARPPGKKPQTMTLLSGGEQALTAMSLIFAVFLTNPAPICVLDEVDAPLDDHNVERFCNLLDRMVRVTETRFVAITHNPITMARMDRLFGVTMAEQGVSQLVSVDLQGAERLREAG